MQAQIIQSVHTPFYPNRIKLCDMQNNIREIRKRLGLTLEQVAERAGTSFAMIQKLETGERRLTTTWMKRISEALRCRPQDLIANEDDYSPVFVKGKLTINGVDSAPLTSFNDSQESKKVKTVPSPMNLLSANLEAYEVSKDRANPLVKEGWLIYVYADHLEPENCAGEQCLIKIKGHKEADLYTIQKLKQKDQKYGKYTLIDTSGQLLPNVIIEWVKRIAAITPNRG